MNSPLFSLIREGLLESHDSWSIGSFGAIGEFHQSAGEELTVDEPDQLTRATTRGGIRIHADILEHLRPVAFETLSPNPRRWGQGMVFCLPTDHAKGNERSVLTALGPDKEALRPEDRALLLFDMGLGQAQIDFCIRTGDPDLIHILNQHEGRSLFEPDNPVMPAILKHHPPRIILSKAGRVEVYQKIGGPETGGVSPEGPHTHLLPKMLKSGRTHSANTPVPNGWLPVLSYHPASPVTDGLGKDIEFDKDRYDRFQQKLENHAPAPFWQARQSVLKAISNEEAPHDILPPASRLERVAMRNTLRQLARLADYEDDLDLATRLHGWRVVYDGQMMDSDMPEENDPHS